jgi:extradiol dioxygenase family protein
MLLQRLHHVQLAMPAQGEARAREFYAGLLGIPEVPKPPELARRGGCWFEHGELREAGHACRADNAFAGHERVFVDDPFGNRLELLQATGRGA